MHRTEGDGHDGNLFTAGDPFIPLPATQVTADWANAVQEELCNVVEGLGGTLETAASDVTFDQVLSRLNAKYGRLDLANTWSGSATFNTSIVGTGAAHEASGAVMPTKYVFAFAALASTVGSNYPLVSLSKMLAGGNTIALNTRANTHGSAPVSDWTEADLELSYDVDGIRGAGGTVRFGTAGVQVASFDTATASTRSKAFSLTNGDLSLDGVANPDSNVALKNTLTPSNIPKAYVKLAVDASTNVTASGAFNIASVSYVSGFVRITFAQAMANANYTVNVSPHSNIALYVAATTATYVDINGWDVSGGAKTVKNSDYSASVTVFGNQ